MPRVLSVFRPSVGGGLGGAGSLGSVGAEVEEEEEEEPGVVSLPAAPGFSTGGARPTGVEGVSTRCGGGAVGAVRAVALV